MRYFLVDNGSLRADSILNLRRLARELGHTSGVEILPASLLHSNRVPAEELDGEKAVNLERRMRGFLEGGERAFTIIPFFFGPTAAITDYLPKRLDFLRQKYGPFHVKRTPFVYVRRPEGRGGLARILASRIRETIDAHGLVRPRVALVDHGSPLPEVTEVRDELAEELDKVLQVEVSMVRPASMERREGEAYAFNEPLLENLLREPGWNEGDVVISMLFLSPGRHAGPNGDVAGICATAEKDAPGLKTWMTDLVGTHRNIIPLLARRLEMTRMDM